MREIFVRLAGALSLAIAVAACLLLSTVPAEADLASEQVPGYDISWPQCPGEVFPQYPVAFTIIGVNGGRPFTPNPCFLAQYRWAQRFERHPAVYLNTDYPKEGRDAPAANGPYGVCAPTDLWCRAYNYGYAAAKEAESRVRALGLAPSMWWLDVETGNYWSDDPTYNGQVLRAMLDYFKERGLRTGFYGTPRQWRIIAGSYSPGTPIWTAGAQGIDQAAARCHDPSYAFGGGTVVMVQYYDFGFDTNYACPGGHPRAAFPVADPFDRIGPYARSIGLDGRVLERWFVVPMLGAEGRNPIAAQAAGPGPRTIP